MKDAQAALDAANAAAAGATGWTALLPLGKDFAFDYAYDGCNTPGFFTYHFTASGICQPKEFESQYKDYVADADNQAEIGV